MKKVTILLTLSLLFVYGCSNEEVLTNEEILTTDSSIEILNKNNLNGVIHHVSVGSNDACEAFELPPGCDKNYSLTANMFADGSVSGKLIDQFIGGGIVATIDCMILDGKKAYVGGFIDKGMWDGFDLAGLYAFTVVKDNGNSKNDTPDQIFWTGFAPSFLFNCDNLVEELENETLLDLLNGQVKVW